MCLMMGYAAADVGGGWGGRAAVTCTCEHTAGRADCTNKETRRRIVIVHKFRFTDGCSTNQATKLKPIHIFGGTSA